MMCLAAGDAAERRITTRSIAVGADASSTRRKAVSGWSRGHVKSKRGRVGGLSLTEEGRTVSVGWMVRRWWASRGHRLRTAAALSAGLRLPAAPRAAEAKGILPRTR
jgi:hypothetical protein